MTTNTTKRGGKPGNTNRLGKPFVNYKKSRKPRGDGKGFSPRLSLARMKTISGRVLQALVEAPEMAEGATAWDMAVHLKCEVGQTQKALGSLQRLGRARSTHDVRKREGFYQRVIYVLTPAGRANFLQCKELAAQCPPEVAARVHESTEETEMRKREVNKSLPGMSPNAKRINKLSKEEVLERQRERDGKRRSIAGPQGESHRYERTVVPEGDGTHTMKSLYSRIQCGLDVSWVRLADHALVKQLDYLRERIAWQLSTHRQPDSAEAWASVSRVLGLCPQDLRQVWEAAA